MDLLYGIAKALGTTYQLDQPYNDPDPAILALNKTILNFDEDLSALLPPAAYASITAHLAQLANRALVSPALVALCPAMDAHGNARMALNILVLQQNLKNLDPGADLGDAARYWELFERGSESIVEAVRRNEIDKDQGLQILGLWGTSEGREGEGQRALEKAMRALE